MREPSRIEKEQVPLYLSFAEKKSGTVKNFSYCTVTATGFDAMPLATTSNWLAPVSIKTSGL
jgi:hypothetical protein